MQLSTDQLTQYHEKGFLFLENVFSTEDIQTLHQTLTSLLNTPPEGTVFEKNSSAVRALHGCHLVDDVCARLVRQPGILRPARQILGDDVYVYQFKVNTKASLLGDVWEWHQDYIFWNMEDGLPRPDAVNIAIFIDEVTEINGPLILLEGSHKEGMIRMDGRGDRPEGYEDSPDWIGNLTADLKYSISKEHLNRLMTRYPPTVPKGPAGSLLFFHPNTVHGSAQNMSAFDRRLMLVTYSHAENRPQKTQRPEFLVSRDFTPLELLHDSLA